MTSQSFLMQIECTELPFSLTYTLAKVLHVEYGVFGKENWFVALSEFIALSELIVVINQLLRRSTSVRSLSALFYLALRR